MKRLLPLAAALLLIACSREAPLSNLPCLPFDRGELRYTKRVTLEQAQELGRYLTPQGFFSRDGFVAEIDRDGPTFVFRYVVPPAEFADEKAIRNASVFARNISREALDNLPIVIHFCDEKFRTRKVVDPMITAPTP